MFTSFAKDSAIPRLARVMRPIIILLLTAFLTMSAGCRNPVDPAVLNSLAKNDVDRLADTSLQEMNRLLGQLLVKLYNRNPQELDKVKGMTVGQRQDHVFDNRGRLIFSELKKKQGTDALNLAFSHDYHGDRVFALMVGLVGVVRSAYNWKTEQLLFDSLDQQKLFNSARNIEVLAWRLSNARDSFGKLLLLSNSQPGEEENLSFERLFGKMIAIQDMLAFTVAGKWERGVNSVLKQAVFLPMGM